MKLPLALLAACFIPSPVLAAVAAQVRATRLWPSPEYSRITLELNEPVPHRYFSLDGPARLVLDLEGVEASQLAGIASLLSADDPYIAGLRVGSPRTGVARLVVELKTDVKPQVFTLKPMGDYGHRLVLDLYPGSEDAIERQMQQAIQQAEQRLRDKDGQGAGNRSVDDYKRLITIVIDPGHGGEDPGAIGATGTREKDVTLAISHLLKEHLDKIDNMRVVLTRDRDYFIPLHERVKKARAQRADLFMSIHADAFLKPTARGSSVFALSEGGATSAAAKWLARKENAADLIGGVNLGGKDPYLRQTLLDLSQTAQIADSLKLGRYVLDQLGGINTLHKAQVEQAGFAVLKAPDIPSILVETAFISNPEEEKKLNDAVYQNKMAAALVDGIKTYFDQNPPLARHRQRS
ncbi:MAG TPA: N-acetylmuramoyl-L-alanine amidase [Thiobacillaceae bacterium]|nr:N-acetylmuramoyl-L-alanine amidase [Thiobacillaceae bacterium]